MSSIEIRYANGKTGKKALSKKQTLSIGKHPSNDVVINDDTVAAMHCRIAWNKSGFEVTAATRDGVEINGTLVRNASLNDRDVLRVGTVDITVRDVPGSGASSTGGKRKRPPEDTKQSQVEEQLGSLTDSLSDLPAAALSDVFDVEEDAEDQWIDGSVSDMPTPPMPVTEPVSGDDGDELPADAAADATPSKTKALSRLRSKPKRPGEQDIIGSPLVLGLGGGALALMLVAATFWFIIGRDTIQKEFDVAQAQMDEGKFAQAITLWEQFILTHPKHKYTDDARFALAQCRVEREISGSAPEWPEGLEQVDDYIKQTRDLPDFAEQHPQICEYARRIAMGAAQTAQNTKDRSLLAVSAEASKILDRYSPADAPPTEMQNLIAGELKKAEAAVLKQEVFDAAMAEMSQALAAKRPILAMEARQHLLERYPELRSDRKLLAKFQETLAAEKDLVSIDTSVQEADTTDEVSQLPAPLTLASHTRVRTDETSEGRVVFAVAKDCCYALDSVTGDPVWRRVIGLDTPFTPQTVSTAIPGLLVFDTNRRELILLEQLSGKLLWRQPLQEEVTGAPLVDGLQIFVTTRGGHLYKVALESGEITARLSFSQELLAPPVLIDDGKSLLVGGDQAVLYTVSVHELTCESVSYLGHLAGSIKAPLVGMGRLVLLAENDRADSCRLRVLDTSAGSQGVKQIAESRVPGQVYDAPVLRGKQLFVPSTDERVAAFTVTDEKNQRVLTPVATQQAEPARSGSLYLLAGPDGQLWMSSSVLRKLRLTTDSFKLDSKQIGGGAGSQPLEAIGRRLFIGKNLPYSGTVVFLQADREEMTSLWKTVLGAEIIATSTPDERSSVFLTEAGDVFYAAESDIKTGGFNFRAAVELKIPEGLVEPPVAAAIGQGMTAVYCGAPEPRLWIIAPGGQIDRELKLEQPLEAAPVLVGKDLLLPLPGRLKHVPAGRGIPAVDDYLLPIGQGKTPRWQVLKSAGEGEIIAAVEGTRLLRIQMRTSPVPHLAGVADLDLEQKLDKGFVVRDGQIFLADASGRLQIRDASDLRLLGEAELNAAPSSPVWLDNDHVYVEVGRQQLHCYRIAPGFPQVWTAPVTGVGLAGAPLTVGDRVVVAKRDGGIELLDRKTGKSLSQQHVGQPLSRGPLRVGSLVVVASIDGSLYQVDVPGAESTVGANQ